MSLIGSMDNNDYERLVLVFITTALWDMLLRHISLGKVRVLNTSKWKWLQVLKPYFESHTLIGAALLAGAAGTAAQLALWALPTPTSSLEYGLQITAVSVVIGWPMYLASLYPQIKKYYQSQKR